MSTIPLRTLIVLLLLTHAHRWSNLQRKGSTSCRRKAKRASLPPRFFFFDLYLRETFQRTTARRKTRRENRHMQQLRRKRSLNILFLTCTNFFFLLFSDFQLLPRLSIYSSFPLPPWDFKTRTEKDGKLPSRLL